MKRAPLRSTLPCASTDAEVSRVLAGPQWGRWLALAFLLAACSSSSKDPGAGAVDAGAAYADSACFACVEPVCAVALSTCRSDPGCAAAVDCALRCPSAGDGPSEACASACGAALDATGASAFEGVASCATAGAKGACASACGAVAAGDGAPPSNAAVILDPQTCAPAAGTGCSKCESDRCCDSTDRCQADAGCFPLNRCVAGCTDWTCEQACYDQYASSVATYAEILGCYGLQCPGADSDCQTPSAQAACITTGPCREEYAACFGDPESFMVYECATYCGADTATLEACVGACKDAHPAGGAAWDAFAACLMTDCPS